MTEVRCRACGSERLEDLGGCTAFSVRATLAFDGAAVGPGRLLRCLDCSLGQRTPCPTDAQLKEIYRRTPSHAMNYSVGDNVAWKVARELIINRFDPRTHVSIVDIGCHTATFLGSLPHEWTKCGVESAEEPSREAVERHNVRIIADRLQSIPAEYAGIFDVVTLFDVVEHLPDPLDGLVRAAQLLKPGGLLVVTSGDMDAWTWKMLGNDHWYLQSPKHVSVVSRAFFRFAAERGALSIDRLMRIAHRSGPFSTRCREFLEVLYWALRRRGGFWRIPQRVLHSLPGLGPLRHELAVPWTMRLRDHVVAVLRNPNRA